MDDPATKVIQADVLVATVAVIAPLLMGLSSLGHHSGHPVLRFFFWGVSAVYTPLTSYVLSFLTSYLLSLNSGSNPDWGQFLLLMLSVVLIQFLRSRADMAALAVAAVTSPVAGDDIDALKIRPSMESLIYSSWVAVLVICSAVLFKKRTPDDPVEYAIPIIVPLWALGACRMVLRFTAFHRATSSFAFGRNAQLISGYMAHLQQGGYFGDKGQPPSEPPRLIVTGERNRDVDETPAGYHVKSSALDSGNGTSLVTLDRVWSERDPLLGPELKELCLSFALFKCLRRRFAGHRLAEAGSSWAFRFVCGGLLGQQDDHERIFRVIADELSFARGFYYSPLPVASLGALSAALHLVLSFLISAWLCTLTVLLLVISMPGYLTQWDLDPLSMLAIVLAAVTASTQISEIIANVRSNWTKISIIGHFIRCRNCCARRIFSCLLRCKSRKHWKDRIGQMELLDPSLFCDQSWVVRLFKQLCFLHTRKSVIKVPPEVKAAVLSSLRSSGGKLSNGTATLWRWCHADMTWACHDVEVTTTDSILVWHIATSLFEIKCASQRDSTTSTAVALSLSRYCMYLVAEAPDLLPDNSAWAKRRRKEVKKGIEAAWRHRGAQAPGKGVYENMVKCLGESSHEVLRKGSQLGQQLVAKASGGTGAGAGGEDAVWKLLAEFWSEMVLYLAPSDNSKGHIEALRRGGELITLLWALLLHAGITSRQDEFSPTACVWVSTGDPDVRLISTSWPKG